MGWKNWPSWLKGGIIGLLAGFISGVVLFALAVRDNIPEFVVKGAVVVTYPFFILFTYLIGILSGCEGEECLGAAVFGGILGVFVEIVIIGAFIGWIVGKIKARKIVSRKSLK